MRTADRVENLLARMTLDEKIGQCLTLWWRGGMVTPSLIECVTRLHCGGFRVEPYATESAIHGYYNKDLKVKGWEPPDDYFTIAETHFNFPVRNTAVSPAAYAKLTNRMQDIAMNRRCGVPLHITTDFEGGFSHDYPFGGVRLFPASMGLRAGGGPALARQVGEATARQLSSMGINMIHSPVCDVNINPDNPEINVRSFSDDPEVLAKYAVQFMKGLEAGGVIATGKHFPGRGDSSVDAHSELPILRASRKRMDEVELLPYRALIRQGLRAIMSAHNAYPALDDDQTPATLSRRILTDVLRGELGFQGVITTDAMGMGAIVKRWGVPVASAMAIAAGADLVLLKFDDELRSQAFFEIKRWVRRGDIPESELDDRVRHILTMKMDKGLFDTGGRVDPDAATATYADESITKLARDVARRCVTLLRDRQGLLPLTKGQKVLIVEQRLPDSSLPGDDHYHAHSFTEAMLDQSMNAVLSDTWLAAEPHEHERILQLAPSVDAVVMTNWFWRMVPPSNNALLKDLLKRRIPVVVVTNSPYPMAVPDKAGTVICTYGPGPESLRAAAAVIYGKAKSRGSWPLEHSPQP